MKIGVYTVPKSGTHFVSDIIALMIDSNTDIYSKEKMYQLVHHLTCKKGLSDCTYFNTHPSYIDLEYLLSINTRLICVIRNPLDVCISRYFYNEKRKEPAKQRSIFEYVKNTIKPVCQEIIYFYQQCNKNNKCIIIKFEDLITNIDNSLFKIYNFINKYNELSPPKYEIIKQKINFNIVQEKEKKNGIYKVGRIQNTLFHRSGKIGQSKEHFSKKQIIQLLNSIPKQIFEFYPSNLYIS